METPFAEWSFLAGLAGQTRRGLDVLPPEAKAPHLRFLLEIHDGRGGFPGRRGGADLYYTSFAARALHALGALEDAGPRPSLREGLARFALAATPGNILDALNILSTCALARVPCPRAEALLAWIEGFRHPGGGYAKVRGDARDSLYHAFLAVLAYNLIGRVPPEPGALVQAALAHGQADGGFSETHSHPCSTTNPTAAGLSLLALLEALEPPQAAGAANWLRGCRAPEGGWYAVPGAPAADLLSTYTAAFSLLGLEALDRREMAEALRFLRQCRGGRGGFTAGPWDAAADAEYTAYGLSLLGLAAAMQTDAPGK